MRKTVFVVGAGASAEFGLPLGSQLAEKIRGGLDAEFGGPDPRDGALTQALQVDGMRGEHLVAAQELRGALLASRSIDHALYKLRGRPFVVQVGKVAIAEAILRGEESCRLPDGANRHAAHQGLVACRATWIARLFASLVGDRSPEEMEDVFDGVSFVIFNYDRCVEQYLYLALQDIGQQTKVAATEIMKKLPVEHVYGQVGPFHPWAQSAQSFGANRYAAAGHAARGIKTYTEGAESGVLSRVQDMISGAARVVFLGFGFDPLNVKALFPAPPKTGQALSGTRFGVPDDDAGWRSFARLVRPGPRFSFADKGCAEFIVGRAGQLMSTRATDA